MFSQRYFFPSRQALCPAFAAVLVINLLSTVHAATDSATTEARSTSTSKAASVHTEPAATGNADVGEQYRTRGEYANPNGDGYPTSVKAEYVMGCMASNGMELTYLVKCSCSIDYIASKLPYDQYTEADTVLRAQLDQGVRGVVFRESRWAREMVDKLQKIQSASNLECF